jgi:ferritin
VKKRWQKEATGR